MVTCKVGQRYGRYPGVEVPQVRHNSSIDINAPLDRVWQTLSDVRRWPDWTKSMTDVRPLDQGPLRVGSRVRVKQPRVPSATWRITRYEPGVRFDWETQFTGVHMTATHELMEAADGHVVVVLSVEQRGPLVRILGRRLAVTAKRYLDMESTGLKAASEA